MRAASIAVVALLGLAACASEPPPSAPLIDPICEACETCEDACDPNGTGLECNTQTCDITGRCLCYLDTAASDCASGCCGVQYDTDGQPILDAGGYPLYGCVEPACVTDADCARGEVCVVGATCDLSYCACDPDGDGDGDHEDDDDDHGELDCCATTNTEGACCESDQVDPETGLCVCTDPLMVDDGDGCVCPTGMTVDEDGACVCYDAEATYDPETGECHCADPTQEQIDSDGTVHCVGPEDCGDDYAIYDVETDTCDCAPGYHYGEHEDYATPRCVPDEDPDADPWDADADPWDAEADADADPWDADADADADAGWDADAHWEGPPWDAEPEPVPLDAVVLPCPTPPSAIPCHVEELP
jgi:hypothetical protein